MNLSKSPLLNRNNFKYKKIEKLDTMMEMIRVLMLKIGTENILLHNPI